MKKNFDQAKKKAKNNDVDWAKDYKMPPPQEFVPTELGSAFFVSVDGQPPDEEFLVQDQNKKNE